ncbi:MAG: hypothetical protein LBV41_12050 [Cytophagaceae bacterium]|jgi:hypothetical protein|nr:hypothetical protein [Cytophagaceae bacterium]
MRHILLSIIFICFIFSSAFAGGSDTIRLGNSYGLQISGFARVDYIVDSRQTSEAVEGLFTFYPLNRELDAAGNDINAMPKANLISVATRLATRFFAPDIFNARSAGYVEFDFTGASNTNGVRLRQAYVNLNWKKSALLIGRTWHPLSAGCIPNMLALNTGAPFWAFNRSDQLRFDYKPNKWTISAAAVYQSDYASLGPVAKSSGYLRDAVLPEISLGAAYSGKQIKLGTMGSVKTIKPRQYTEIDGMKYCTDEKLTTFSALAYMQYNVSDLTVKVQAMYAQNMTESLMLGGYAIKEYNPATGHEKYTPTVHASYWINIDYGKKWQAGIFAGYLNSMGTLDNVAILQGTTPVWFARAPDIKYMYRISPHIIFNKGNLQIAGEVEYTTAAYGQVQHNRKSKIADAREVANIRTNLVMCFFF